LTIFEAWPWGYDIKVGKGCNTVTNVDGQQVGVRAFRERYSNRYIVIGVEVKPETFHFGKKLGQALGYSLFAHKVYLACREDFTVTQIELASKLGAGLIQIKKKAGCAEVLGSRIFEPNKEKMLTLLAKQNLGECMLCGSVFSFDSGYSENLHKAVEHKLIFGMKRKIDVKDFPSFKGSKKETGQWLFLCRSCNQLFKEGQYKFK
jgi:hypothetical protein